MLDVAFLLITLGLAALWWRARVRRSAHEHAAASLVDRVLSGIAAVTAFWLVGGWGLALTLG